MNDDWRLRVDLHKDEFAELLTAHLEGSELEHDLETTFHDRVVVSADGPEVFCYTGSREQAERAEQVIKSVAAQRKWTVDFELKHWHPVAEEWEDADAPLPADAEDRAAEHAEMIRQQRAESAAQGHPNYEVRVQCKSHHDTRKLADRLEQEGLALVRRWHYLLLGAADEDEAKALAERIRAEAPEGCEVTATGNLLEVYEEGPQNPFAVLGGLGG
jgi:hypothetical protein